MTSPVKRGRITPAKLVFNPLSGPPGAAPQLFTSVIGQLQAHNLAPEVCLVQDGVDLAPVIRDALRRGLQLFVVCGGDGTIARVAKLLYGTRARLGIIPAGTRNNVARSLNLPADFGAAVALLRAGRRLKVDMGWLTFGGKQRPFLEVCSVGLFAALYEAADDVQHGKLARLGDVLTALFATPPSLMKIVLDRKHKIDALGHGLVVNNSSYFGLNYQVAPASAFMDGRLDVHIFADLSKLELLSGALQMAQREARDPRVLRYRARQIEIHTEPPMAVMVDGVSLGEGPLKIHIKRKALGVIAGPDLPPAPPTTPDG